MGWKCWFIVLFPCFLPTVLALVNGHRVQLNEIRLGILDRGAKYRNVFEFAIKYIEEDLKDSILPNVKIIPLYREVSHRPLDINKRVFELLQDGVVSIICLCPSSITQQVANFANAKKVPVIAVTATDPLLANKHQRPYLLRISPSDQQQSKAIAAILAHYNWLHFSILTSYDSYANSGSLVLDLWQDLEMRKGKGSQERRPRRQKRSSCRNGGENCMIRNDTRIHGVSGIQEAASSRNWKVNNIQHFNVPDDIMKLNVTKELKRIYESESRIIILNCGASAAGQVLQQASKFDLTRAGYAWIVTDGVTGNFNELMPIKWFGAHLDGLVGTQPATKDGTLYRWFIENFSTTYDIKRRDITPFGRLAFDSIVVFATALDNFYKDNNTISEQHIDIWDDNSPVFEDGPKLFDFLKKVNVSGTTKSLYFDYETGEIKNAKYDIVNFVSEEGYFREVGYWTPGSGVRITDEVVFSGPTTKVPPYQIDTLQGRHLVLGIDIDPPFVMEDTECGTDNACYSGYCIELVRDLSKMLGFTYEFIVPGWGGLDAETGAGSGIFNSLLNNEIDIATVHMSVNSIREKYIDFSVPFMQAGLTVVVRGQEETSDGYFFLSPFSTDVLYAIGAGILTVIIVVWVYNRISPYGLYWSRQYALMSCHCNECKKRRKDGRQFPKHQTCALKELEARDDVLAHLNMANSSWIVVASLLNQDPVESWPTSLPGRIVLLFWWLVVMVVLAMYTANLAAFLTITKMTTGLTKIEDLLTQSRYQWGTVEDTHPEIALANSVRQDFKEIIRKQDAVKSTNDGFKRVLEQDYAFIYESPIFEYMKRKHCSLQKVGSGEFLSFDYAFGFPPDSPYIDVVNRALLELQENSRLDTLWSTILQNTGQCPPRQPPSARLTLQSLNGVFTVLSMGLVLSVFALLGEYVYVTWNDVNGKTTGCPNTERPKTMLSALKRRIKYLLWDFKRSTASAKQRFSMETIDTSYDHVDLSPSDNSLKDLNSHKLTSNGKTLDDISENEISEDEISNISKEQFP